MNYFSTSVKDIGASAKDFESENMMILFGDDAPEGLKDYCYNIQVSDLEKSMEVGDTITFDAIKYTLTAVGSEANTTFKNLGHMTVKFDSSEAADLTGTIHVEAKDYPKIQIGTTITLEKE